MELEHLQEALEHLQEGERAYGAWHYNAPAQYYHGVSGPDGAMSGDGPVLENDSRVMERHIQRLSQGRPLDVVVQDLLETGSKSKSPRENTKSMSPHEKMLMRLSSSSKLNVYRGKIR